MKLYSIVLALLFNSPVSAMEFTRGLVLETNDGVHVGFALGSPSFKGDSGECVFMLLPASAGVIETPLGIIVSELKVAGEQSWRKDRNRIIVHNRGRTLLTIESDGAVLDAGSTLLGKAKPLPEGR
jgi:hypothetical protein